MANYIVTGAARFIGEALAQRLISEGHYVVTIDNLSTGFEENIPDGVDFIQGDCADISICEQLPNIKYEAIFHIAGQNSGEISFDDLIYDIRTNAESTLLLLKYALKKNNVNDLFMLELCQYMVLNQIKLLIKGRNACRNLFMVWQSLQVSITCVYISNMALIVPVFVFSMFMAQVKIC